MDITTVLCRGPCSSWMKVGFLVPGEAYPADAVWSKNKLISLNSAHIADS